MDSLFLYHYYIKAIGPFKSLTDLNFNKPEDYIEYVNKNNMSHGINYDCQYFARRIKYEALCRMLFIEKGGIPERKNPQYMILGRCDEFEKSQMNNFIKIHIDLFDKKKVSFTYGDMFPNFNENNKVYGKEYFGKVYLYDEILKLIDKYGYPQVWNRNGSKGYERYVEAQIWSNEVIGAYYR